MDGHGALTAALRHPDRYRAASAFKFLTEQLRPELLKSACKKANIPLTLRRQGGYDPSYYFISTFMSDHLRWHAARLKA
jgi:S-formylglutathione hydrolase